MSADILASLINGTWKHPDTQEIITLPIKEIQIAPRLRHEIVERLQALDIGKRLLVVSDRNTYEVMGKYIQSTPILSIEHLVFPVEVKAEMGYVRKLIAYIEEHPAIEGIVAVGSGTINDICKYGSYHLGRPYVICATAPSMNGYSSANAAIMVEGHKQSLAAQLPTAIYVDLDIIQSAPKRLIQSGLGDSICRSTAQADWLLSHKLLNTPYQNAPFAILAEAEQQLFAHAAGVLHQQTEAIEALIHTLLLSGCGMVIAQGSYPASQAEHLIAHTMEMKHGAHLPQSFHGEHIAITTLIMCDIQAHALQESWRIRPNFPDMKALSAYFGAEVAAQCVDAYKEKQFTPARCDALNAHLIEQEEAIKRDIAAVMLPKEMLAAVLDSADISPDGHRIGWKKTALAEATYFAKYIRNRFTFLDIAALSLPTDA